MSDKILVYNTSIVINDYNIGDCVQLENNFRIVRNFREYYIGIYYDQDTKKLYLPRGIDLWYLEKLFEVQPKIMVNSYNKFYKYNDVMIKALPRDDTQRKTLRFMLGKGEFSNLQNKSQLAVNLYMGKGKTYLTIASLVYLGIRGIIIASSSGWLNQWYNEILAKTDLTDQAVYVIVGSGSIHRLKRMTEQQLSKYKIFLITHSLLRSYASDNGWESIRELFEYLQIGIKVFDEAHLDYNNICMIDYFTNVYKTYYLTASPGRSDDIEDKIYRMSFKNIPKIDLFNENEDPHTDYIAIFFNSRPTAGQISLCKNKYGLDRNRYTDYVVNQENFNKLIIILMDLCNRIAPNQDDKILIYIGTNNSIRIVYEFLINNYPELYDNIGIYTSIVSAEEKRLTKTKRIILSTTKSAGAALDIKGLKVTINLAEPYKSAITAKQSIGRTRADNTFYLDIIDTGFEQCRKFYYKKLPIFQKYSKSCSVIKLNQDELDERYNNIINKRIQVQSTPKKLFSPINNKRLFSRIL